MRPSGTGEAGASAAADRPHAGGTGMQSDVLGPPRSRPDARPAVKRRKGPGRTAVLFIVPFAVPYLLFFLVPVAYAFYESLQTVQRTGTFGPARHVFGGLTQYRGVLDNGPFWSAFGRVALFGVVQVPVMLLLALVFALLLDSPLLRGKRFFRLALFAPYAVPGVIAAIMWGFWYSPSLSPVQFLADRVDFFGPNLVLWSIANIVTWVYVGYNMLIIYSALLAIPPDLFEAARLDGAKNWQIAWHVKIPLVAPALVLTTVFSIIGTFQLLAEPQTLQSFSNAISSTYTPNLTVYTTASIPNYSLAAAMSVVLAGLTFVLSFGFMRLTRRKALG